MHKNLSVSLVIPCHNEEWRIANCLESIKRQNVSPDEVIIVDNNCTDNTLKIAGKYSFVRVVRERKQGLIAARNKGFDVANSQIIAKLDADTTLNPEWVANVKRIFADKEIDGATGPIKMKWLTFLRGSHKTAIWGDIYFHWCEAFFGVKVLSGGNMVLRKKTWQKIKNETAKSDNSVHEDQDVSVLVAKYDGKIVHKKGLSVGIDASHYHVTPKFFDYLSRHIKTKIRHHRKKTLKNSKQKTGLARRFVLMLITAGPCFIFGVTSFISWPFYAISSKH